MNKFLKILTFCAIIFTVSVILSGCDSMGSGVGKEVDSPDELIWDILGAGYSERLELCAETVKMSEVKQFLDICYQGKERVSVTTISPNHNDAGRYSHVYVSMDEDEQFVWFKTFMSGFTQGHLPSAGDYLAEGYLICKTNPKTNKTCIVRLFAESLK
jgi:hypothetical protein